MESPDTGTDTNMQSPDTDTEYMQKCVNCIYPCILMERWDPQLCGVYVRYGFFRKLFFQYLYFFVNISD